ncbi:FHS family L-fucose permease-like MFS transporter [Arcticibacter tournemirensis]|uniref:MFS transporter n=1 Tax=Arcticibacter tournemirensis TaxID=699437 RepID=A0A4Q0MGC6_9SPHI|nr:MFS transporter [Arcticibacter tournemirensis]KAA8483558.1 sugar MFS transporter [Arcticibacter tournemirensis]RXF72587.1 MFS transporter [Arcticibacter tournemirensis]TQM51493.1 FHS family L-fucose permease-like MFS transporter [Arcticibacter tournemirensis]
MQANESKNYGSALYTLVMVFFFWGFVAASNDILIPVFKDHLHLEQWQSMLIAFAFYVAYTVGSLIYNFISKLTGGDILNRIGYRNGIAVGLVISALGTLLFYPAAESASFILMISGLFIVGLGFSLQQTAANPLAIAMGDPKTGAQRLSLTGGVNNFGTTIGPILVSMAIFGSVSTTGAASVASISMVKVPYLILGALFILVAVIFMFSSIPNKLDTQEDDSSAGTVSNVLHHVKKSALDYPQLVMGMIGIFVYVGVEVSTAANLPEFMKQHVHTKDGLPFPTENIAPFVSLYWASLMIGRWTASVGAFNLSDGTKKIMRFIMPYIAFGVFLLINKLASHDITPFYVYGLNIVVLIIADLLSKGNPARQLLIFSSIAIAALFLGMLTEGMVSVYAFISVGLFCSTLWPCIFTLAIAGLGKHTNAGSSLLVMMIMGGGIISLLQGYVADAFLGIQWSYLVGVLCFAYLAFYAWRVSGILKKQGIDFDKTVAGGH